MPMRRANISGNARHGWHARPPSARRSWPRARWRWTPPPRPTRCWSRWHGPARNRARRHETTSPHVVTPAKAGVQRLPCFDSCKSLDYSLRSPLRGQPSAVQRSRGSLLSGFRRDDERDAGRLTMPMKRADVVELFTRLRELNPQPTTELAYTTPFELLVAVVLSAQATDVGVNKATRKLYPVANTPQAILALGEEGLKKYISTIGLFNAKAKNVVALCGILLEQHDGEVPRTREALEALPGVGRKTANVVLNTA